METGDCPRDEELAAWAQGKSSEERVVALRTHAATCASCRTVVAELVRTSGERPVARTLGRYELSDQLGAGGMGTVYAAWDPVVKRKVAVKLLHEAGSGDASQRAQRFLLERQVLAGLEHPNITRLLDAGEAEDGRPWFAMDQVDGQPIDAACDARKLGPRERLRLLLPALSAVSYAHQHLVVHRDLKPANVFVDSSGAPRLMDFGIARMLEGSASLTRTGVTPMTPAYASPEQVRREPAAVTSDIYSLGVTMYELLTGVSPYTAPTGDVEALLRAVQQEDVKPPSEAIARASDATVALRGASREALRRELEGDLDAIVMMALRKEPADRYSSVDALADDVRAALDGLPTVARRGNASYQAARFVRRRKALVASVIVAFIALSVGLAATLWQARSAARERDLAQARFKQVRSLARSVLFEYHDGIAKLAGSTPLRAQLASDAQRYLEALSAEAQDDIALRTELAAAYVKLGDVQGDPFGASLGNTTAAKESYVKGQALAESVLAAKPDDWEGRRIMASTHEKLGSLREVAGALDEALVLYELARTMDVKLVAERPEDPDIGLKAARDELSIAQTLMAIGALDKAAERLEHNLIERRELTKRRNDPPARRGIAATLLTLSSLRAEQAKVPEAIEHALEAEAIMTAIVKELPDDPEPRRLLQNAWSTLAQQYRLSHDGDRAVGVAERSLEGARALLKLDPTNAVAQRDLVVALGSMAMAIRSSNTNDVVRLKAVEKEAIEAQRALVASDPANPQLIRDLVFLLVISGDGSVERKEFADAVRIYVEAQTLAANTTGTVNLAEHVASASLGLSMAYAGMEKFDLAIAESEKSVAALVAILEKEPGLNRTRNLLAITMSQTAVLSSRKAELERSPTVAKGYWRRTQDATLEVLAFYETLERENALTESSAPVRKDMLELKATCEKMLK